MGRFTKIRITLEEVRNAVQEEIPKLPKGSRTDAVMVDALLDSALYWVESIEKALRAKHLMD